MTQEQWHAIQTNDKRYDGKFFYGVKTTRNVCKPSCAARSCKPEHVVIFDTLQQALDAGYHPCHRCRPDLDSWEGPKAELARLATQYIREHSQEKFSLQALSQALFVNPNYLLRIYKENTGHTLLWYHNFVRCEQAAELLQRPDCSVAYISRTVGYANASHFARVFKAYYQVSPLEYRKQFFARSTRG